MTEDQLVGVGQHDNAIHLEMKRNTELVSVAVDHESWCYPRIAYLCASFGSSPAARDGSPPIRVGRGSLIVDDVPSTLADEYLPTFDVSDERALVVDASAAEVWTALMNVDLMGVGRRRPLVGALGALRALPELASQLLHGERPAAPPKRLTLKGTTELGSDGGGWLLLGEREGEEIALGLVGKFWRPVIQYAQVDAPGFRDFSESGYAKTVYALGVRPIGERSTLLWALMRTATTDDSSRRWFRRYWTFGVGSGAHTLVNGLLDVVRESAEDSELTAASAV